MRRIVRRQKKGPTHPPEHIPTAKLVDISSLELLLRNFYLCMDRKEYFSNNFLLVVVVLVVAVDCMIK